jgi:hypothetical protein
MGRASPDGREALPTPHQTHAGQRPAPTSADPRAQEVYQPCKGVPRHIGSGTAIEGDRRHTPAGATLPPGSVPPQGLPVMGHERRATHRSPSSPCLSYRWPTTVSPTILPYSWRGVNSPLGSRDGGINPRCLDGLRDPADKATVFLGCSTLCCVPAAPCGRRWTHGQDWHTIVTTPSGEGGR